MIFDDRQALQSLKTLALEPQARAEDAKQSLKTRCQHSCFQHSPAARLCTQFC